MTAIYPIPRRGIWRSDTSAGGHNLLEYWISAENLDDFTWNIAGTIEIIAKFPAGDLPCADSNRALARLTSSVVECELHECDSSSGGAPPDVAAL